ncbi:MAG: DUF5615 family PIN-like protein [Bacteroidota bacterium]
MNAEDLKIWNFAKDKEFIIVTQDSDFNDLTNLYGFPPKVIWIRVGNHSTLSINKLLYDHESEIRSFQSNKEYGCFEITQVKPSGS